MLTFIGRTHSIVANSAALATWCKGLAGRSFVSAGPGLACKDRVEWYWFDWDPGKDGNLHIPQLAVIGHRGGVIVTL